MTRNLDRRIELMFPVERAPHKAIVLGALRAMFRDNVKARRLHADGIYRPVGHDDGEPGYRVQDVLLNEAMRRAAQRQDQAGLKFQPERAGGADRTNRSKESIHRLRDARRDH
jgi:polyphosphate kinase